jgi:hypothetical protein
MTKSIKSSNILTEIKKDLLKEHLKVVEEYIKIWLNEFNVPSPFIPKPDSAWQAMYLPSTEQDPDSNHMIRHHIRSRALWGHHTKWVSILEEMWALISKLHQETRNKQKELSGTEQRQFTPEFTSVALWKGFEVADGRELVDLYKIPDSKLGISYGAYQLELSAVTQEQRNMIEQEHRKYINSLSTHEDMLRLVTLWNEVIDLTKQMWSIGNKILKSHDILYPCSFCKHLYK